MRGIISGYLQEKEAKEAAALPPRSHARRPLQDRRRLADGGELEKRLGAVSTPNNDFSLHLGGWVQYDNVFWNQSGPLINAQGAAGSQAGRGLRASRWAASAAWKTAPTFRRIRLQTDGNFWENYEYTLTLALENNQFNTIGLDEFWVGAKNIPFIGTARAGPREKRDRHRSRHVRLQQIMTFLERSSYSEAIELNQNFVTGLWLGNNYFNERATWSSVIFRPDNGAASGVFYGNGQWAAQGRLTALPLYENDGRRLLHLGLSGGWRSGTTNNPRSRDLKTVHTASPPGVA